MKTNEKIQQQITENPVIIYMKGTPQLPQCGFSGTAVKTLASTEVPFAFVNVLQDPWIFEGLPSFSNWPTFPQIFIDGELVGGGDIIVEMAKDGTLKPIMEAAVKKSGQALAESS